MLQCLKMPKSTAGHLRTTEIQFLGAQVGALCSDLGAQVAIF